MFLLFYTVQRRFKKIKENDKGQSKSLCSHGLMWPWFDVAMV